jgi:hypothetical protein
MIRSIRVSTLPDYQWSPCISTSANAPALDSLAELQTPDERRCHHRLEQAQLSLPEKSVVFGTATGPM